MKELWWEGDAVELEVLVTDPDDDTPVDITGATITAAAKKGASTVSAGTAISDAPAGLFDATFTAGALAAGRWLFQARVVVGSGNQIVIEDEITVRVSHV